MANQDCIYQVIALNKKNTENDQRFYLGLGNSIVHQKNANNPIFTFTFADANESGVLIIENAYKSHRPYAIAILNIENNSKDVSLLKQLWQIDSNLQIILITSNNNDSWKNEIEAYGVNSNLIIITKPFNKIQLYQWMLILSRKWHNENKSRELIKTTTEDELFNQSLTRSALDSSADGILIINQTGKILEYNTRFISMWNLKKSLPQNLTYYFLLKKLGTDLKDPQKFIKKMKELTIHADLISLDVIKLKDGRVFEFYSQPQKFKDKLIGRVWSFRDITQRVILEERLQHTTNYDTLTGLPNRKLLKTSIQRAAKLARDQKSLLTVFFISLDNFKLFNESLSFDVSDKLVFQICHRLKQITPSSDCLLRISSDEFILVSPLHSDKAAILKIAKQILTSISELIIIDDQELTITASIGISIYPKDTTNLDFILRNADAATHYAKNAGGNQVKFFHHKMHEHNLKLLENETQLRRALINNEFILCYQPQIDLRTEKLIGVEALIRWQHPTRGLLYPNDFLVYAEQTGLIIPISEWILRTACQQLKLWHKIHPDLHIAVNVSAQQFHQYDFIKNVVDTLQQTKLPPHFLELELTENTIFAYPNVVDTLNALKEIGVRIVIDDFGTGYSGLSFLKELSVDRLKIDSSFVKNIDKNKKDEAIIRSIVDIARNLNYEVLAEGVENKMQYEFLKSKKIGQIQGFYFSQALKTQEIEDMIISPERFKEILKL